MARACDVAAFIIDMIGRNPNEDLVTNLRLNKLLYFAQVGSKDILGYLLIDDDFEAWPYGPVVPAVYNMYKRYGRNGIATADFDKASLTRQEQLYLLDVLRTFKDDSTSALVKKSHQVNGPWDIVTKKREKIIPKEAMAVYCTKNPLINAFKTKYKDSDFVGYRDADGHLVLPKELDNA